MRITMDIMIMSMVSLTVCHHKQLEMLGLIVMVIFRISSMQIYVCSFCMAGL